MLRRFNWFVWLQRITWAAWIAGTALFFLSWVSGLPPLVVWVAFAFYMIAFFFSWLVNYFARRKRPEVGSAYKGDDRGKGSRLRSRNGIPALRWDSPL